MTTRDGRPNPQLFRGRTRDVARCPLERFTTYSAPWFNARADGGTD